MADKLQLGLIVGLHDDMVTEFRKIEDLGIPTCQVTGTVESYVNFGKLDAIATAMAKTKVDVSAIFMAYDGQTYNTETGPSTDGLIPEEHRARRTEMTLKAADLIKDLGVATVVSHVGFIPDDETDELYTGFLESMKTVAKHLDANDQVYLFETGQELPSTLKRTIDHVGTGNLFVNLDPANLILYGKANPLDAVAILGPWVRGMHAKDGIWPNRDETLGHETRLGDGKVNFPLLLRRLKACGFQGPVTIEREISGPQQIEDIKYAMRFLDPML
ncbi:MAG: sugar phosphate isomerase/epimerase [Phycisphaerae bacterium]|nr:sugar phosphate isomerase/epimerase [Phycisphaerae bacterium]